MKLSKTASTKTTFIPLGTIVLIAYFTTMVLPLTTSWDGYLYIGSGHALLNDEMARQYHWIRDPLYPFFIGVLNEVGIPRLITFIQALFLLIGIYAFAMTIAARLGGTRMQAYIATLATYVFVFGYAASILQQSLLVFLSGLFVYSLFSIRRKEFRLFSIVAILVLLALTSAVVAAGAICLLVLSQIFDDSTKKGFRFLTATLGLIAVLGSVFIWSSFKASYENAESNYPGPRNFWEMTSYNQFSIPDKVLAIPSTIVALNSVGVEFFDSSYGAVGNENRIFGTPSLEGNQSCGRNYPGPVDYIERSVFLVPSYCVEPKVVLILSAINFVLGLVLPLASFSGLLVTFWVSFPYFRKRKFHTLVAIFSGQLLLIPFWLANVAISRLGLMALIANLLILFIVASKKLPAFRQNASTM